MGKGRFTALDVQAQCMVLTRELYGCRIVNIYDLSSRAYLIKLNKPGEVKSTKHYLLLESGIRFHTTKFSREKAVMPNAFACKLRKHLKNKRVEEMKQIGGDRVAMFSFGTEEYAYHIVIEIYAGGNIILLNYQYHILACLRIHQDVRVGATYPVWKEESEIDQMAGKDYVAELDKEIDRCESHIENLGDTITGTKLSKSAIKKLKKAGKIKMWSLGDFMIKILRSSSSITEHCLMKAKLDMSTPLITIKDDVRQKIVERLDVALKTYKELIDQIKRGDVLKGYLVYRNELLPQQKEVVLHTKVKKKQLKEDKSIPTVIDAVNDTKVECKSKHGDKLEPKTSEKKDEKKADEELKKDEPLTHKVYVEFLPVKPDQFSNVLIYDTFNECVDIFFSTGEVAKVERTQKRAEHVVLKKLDRAKKQHKLRIEELTRTGDQATSLAKVITANIFHVNAAIKGTKGLIMEGLDWEEIGARIREQTLLGNPIARLVTNLNLSNNEITLKLPIPNKEEEEDDEDDESGSEDGYDEIKETEKKFTNVTIDISKSGYANAAFFYAKRKACQDKATKTAEHTEQAIKAAERRSRKKLKECEQIARIEVLRTILWFEKYHWFFSSEGYLIIGGRDAQQNELIVKRHMNVKFDLFVHADIRGASCMIIKNHKGVSDVPPKTLEEAGIACACRSIAWSNNVATQSYWVYGYQVSKSAPSGEYLGTGSWFITGKKNFLPMANLIMGFGIMFRLKPESWAKRGSKAPVWRKPIKDPKLISSPWQDEEANDEQQNPQPTPSTSFPPTPVESGDTSTTKQSSCCREDNDPADISLSKSGSTDDLTSGDKVPRAKKSRKKRGGFEDEEEPEPGLGNKEHWIRQKGRISRSERRRMRKAKKLGISVEELPIYEAKVKPTKKKVPDVVLPRRKAAKLRKLKLKAEKYGEMSDYERELTMQLLGSVPVKLNSAKDDFQQTKEQDEKPPPAPAEEGESLSKHLKEQRELMRKRRAEANERVKALKKQSQQSGNMETEEQVHRLVHNPKKDDELEFAIPMVAPWKVVQSWAYSYKLQPGIEKRGKAAKKILHALIATCQEHHKPYMRSVKDTECIQVMLTGLKIAGLPSKKKKFKGRGRGRKG